MGEMLLPRNEFATALFQNESFLKNLHSELAKADTINQATNLVWYDLRPVVQLLYPFKELIPLVSGLPRVNGMGGTGYHWKRIVAINVNNVSLGVGEGQRGGRIAITEQDQSALYKTLGLESSITRQAEWANGQLVPNSLAIATQSTLRSVMIGEEQTLVLANATNALEQTPTPTLVALTSSSGTFSGATVYVICVALAGMGWLGYTAYNVSTGTGGVPGQITKGNADGSSNTFGGGSAKPSSEANVVATSTDTVQATVSPVPGAVAYAWFVGTTSGAETLAGITQANQAIFTKVGALLQPITSLQVAGVYQDNSTNNLLPDGILPIVNGSAAIFGPAPGTTMATNPNLPDSRITISPSGSLLMTASTANTGLTISGTNILEFDVFLQAAYDQYKIGYTRILMSSLDIAANMGAFFGSGDTAAQFRILFDADQATGRITAGRRVTAYLNKYFGNTLDIEIHPYLPPGNILFWSDNIPYELSGVQNIFEAHVRQDYYQIQWPWRTMTREFGVYLDEVFACYFPPAFGLVTNLNPTTGTPTF